MSTTTELTFSSARELAAAIRGREVSSVEVVSAHLDAVERVDPEVNAMVTVLAEPALAQAHESDAVLARGDAVGALHGVPVAIKDYTQTAGVRTTLGSPICRLGPGRRRASGRAPEARRGDLDREDERPRVRRRLADLQRGLRRHAESLRHVAHVRR
jgi:hypothetical protein